MGIDVATEQDIERLRMFSELQARELENARRKLAVLARKLAEREGLDPQTVLEALLEDIASDVNGEGSKSPLDSNSERWSGESTEDDEDSGGEPQRGHGPTDQPDLPEQEVLCELDEADQVCPKCGGELKEIEGLTEDSTEIDVVEVQYVVRQVKKQKYRCTCSDCQHIETALGPQEPKPVKGGRYTTRFAVEAILDKYASHLPLDRQSRRMKALGLRTSSQTLWDYTWACARWLEPTWEVLQELVLDEEIVGADETRWRLMGKKRNAKPSIIALTSDAGVWYGFEHDKTAETVDRLLGDFTGVLIADGLSVYPAVLDRRTLAYEQLETELEPFTLAQCWVHARRNYIKASRGDPVADEMVLLIGRLYRLKRAYDPELHDLWVEWVDVVLRGMREWMVKQRPRPGSKLKQAIGYMDDRWKALTLFRDNPAIWLDNNGTERALRGPILGRKNHYGSRSDRGMLAASIFYSLIETCSRLKVDARAYLNAALARVIDNPGAVYTPHDFLDEHAD